MAKLIDWIKKTGTRLVDPEREDRVRALATALERRLFDERERFDFQMAIDQLGLDERDFEAVREKVFRRALKRAWKDSVITDQERKASEWVGQAVQIDANRRREIEWEVGQSVVETFLANAFSDGRLDPKEIVQLQQIARGLNTEVRTLVSKYFSAEGEAFLSAMFTMLSAEGCIGEQAWNRFIEAGIALGFTQRELTSIIRPKATRMVEHALADAASDGRLSPDEHRSLDWLMANLNLDASFVSYVREQLRRLHRLTEVHAGRLPVISSKASGLRAGEAVHLESDCAFIETKVLKNGPRTQSFYGRFTITDLRLIFVGEFKSFDVGHQRVLELLPFPGGLEVRTSGKGSGRFQMNDPELAIAVYEAAIKRANQTLTQQVVGAPDRHIPRDVRQRVWQRYGGRCADCSADQYLEFDHIVPVARGGSSSESNVQLLCRRCNLKKSDRI